MDICIQMLSGYLHLPKVCMDLSSIFRDLIDCGWLALTLNQRHVHGRV